MGLYYKLNNGEEIEIVMETTENYERKVFVKLFNGSTVFEYDCTTKIVSLKKITISI